MQMRTSDVAGDATSKFTRDAARTLNPLIGISSKDTMSLVAGAMRSLTDSEQPSVMVCTLVAELAAAALEWEGV